jgi:predicted Zn-dependent peptidase
MLSEAVNATAFQEHPYQWSVIGYESDIKNWTKEDLEKYFKTYYAPNNCVVVISGNVKLEEVKRLAEKYMAPIPAGVEPKAIHLVEPPQSGERRITIQKEVPTPYLILAYHTPEAMSNDFYPLSILSAALTSGNSSRLYVSLVDKKQLANTVSSSFGESFDPNLFKIYAVAAKDIQEHQIEEAIYEEIQQIIAGGISDQELQKIKNQKLMEFYGQIETINGKSNNIGTYELFFGDYKKMFDAPAAYSKVSIEDVKRVASQYFKKSNRTVGVLKSKVEE